MSKSDRLVQVGEPFKAAQGFTTIEAAVYDVEGFGRRVIPTSRDREGKLLAPRASNCLHGRPILPNPMDVAQGDRAAYAQICRLCEYEAQIKARPK